MYNAIRLLMFKQTKTDKDVFNKVSFYQKSKQNINFKRQPVHWSEIKVRIWDSCACSNISTFYSKDLWNYRWKMSFYNKLKRKKFMRNRADKTPYLSANNFSHPLSQEIIRWENLIIWIKDFSIHHNKTKFPR